MSAAFGNVLAFARFNWSNIWSSSASALASELMAAMAAAPPKLAKNALRSISMLAPPIYRYYCLLTHRIIAASQCQGATSAFSWSKILNIYAFEFDTTQRLYPNYISVAFRLAGLHPSGVTGSAAPIWRRQ